jgi:hypothetical protein
MSSSDPNFRPALQSLWDSLTEHFKEEEGDDLPALERVLDPEASMGLASSFARTKHFVPTRSHPSAPNRPPYETVAGMLATPIDKMRDMFAKFPKDEQRKGGVLNG